MSNVIRLAFRSQSARPLSQDGGLHRLLEAFALHRRRTGDPFWLKENAEVLGILVAINARVPESALAVYRPFLDEAADMLAFHPQYYRLILNVVVNLEALGMPTGLATRMAEWILTEDWPASEVNDRSFERVRHLLAREPARNPNALLEIERYGLSAHRSLEAFEAYAGVDFRARTVLNG